MITAACKKEYKRNSRRFTTLLEGGLMALGATSDGLGEWNWSTTAGKATIRVGADESGLWAYVGFDDANKACKQIECSSKGALDFRSHGTADVQAAAILAELSLLYAG